MDFILINGQLKVILLPVIMNYMGFLLRLNSREYRERTLKYWIIQSLYTVENPLVILYCITSHQGSTSLGTGKEKSFSEI